MFQLVSPLLSTCLMQIDRSLLSRLDLCHHAPPIPSSLAVPHPPQLPLTVSQVLNHLPLSFAVPHPPTSSLVVLIHSLCIVLLPVAFVLISIVVDGPTQWNWLISTNHVKKGSFVEELILIGWHWLQILKTDLIGLNGRLIPTWPVITHSLCFSLCIWMIDS